MNISEASKLCESHGAVVLRYEPPRVAVLRLRSGEQVMISIGTASAKMFRQNSILGWYLPKCCASTPLATWDERYPRFNNLHRTICQGMALDGLVSLISRLESIDE